MAGNTHAEFYSRSDMKDLLEAIDSANGGVIDQIDLPQFVAYRAGFRDALRAIAVAVGVKVLVPGVSSSLFDDRTYWVQENGKALSDTGHGG